MTHRTSEISLPVKWGEMKARVWGPDDGYPVLCLHGWLDNCGSFNTLIPLLPKECRYVTLDQAGHGLSSHRPPGLFYTFLLFVEDVRRVVAGLNWTKFSIIGHSMGGNIAAMHTVVTVPGDHHVHLNNPEVVAPLISDFLQTNVIPRQLSAV